MTITEEVESKIDIVELVREYVPLKKAGVNFKGLSPFKHEKTPSFVVSPAKQIAYCFSTNQGGGPIRFLMLIEKLEFKEALQILAKRAGVELKTDYLKEKGDNAGQLYEAYEIALDFYHDQLFQDKHSDKLQYLLDRGLSIASIKEWKLGFSDNPRDLFFKLKNKGLEDQLITSTSGLFINPHKDKFFGRVIFPIYNYRGSVVAFSGRTLSTEKKVSKYVNSPETPIFHKSKILFGMHRAKQSISQENKVIVVEGQMDVISLHEAGFTSVVGISGTALTTDHIRQIRRLTDQIYLCLDNDDAGKKAIFSCIENLANQDVDIHVIQLGAFKDPDEIILSKDEDFQTYIDNAISHIEFMLREGKEKHDTTTIQGKKKLVDEVMTYMTQIKSTVEVDLYLQQMSEILGISLQILWSTYNEKRESLRFRNTSKQVPEAEEKNKSSTPAEDLMVFIIGTKDADFFRDHFLFFDYKTDLAHLQKIFEFLDSGHVSDEDKMRYELMYEQQYADLEEDTIITRYKESLQRLNKMTFDLLQKKLSADAGNMETFKKLNALNALKSKLFL